MGKATAEMLVELGANVYGLDWNEVDVPGIQKYIHVNLAEKESIDDAFAQIPDTIDSFFGVAGISGLKHNFNTTVIIDFIANKYITEEYLEKRISEGGAIVYCTSTGGLGWQIPEIVEESLILIKQQGWENTCAALESMGQQATKGGRGYAFAKRALNYYVAYIVEKFGVKKVRVNAVLPGSTDTGLTDDFIGMVGTKENLVKMAGFAQRLAASEEMAYPMVFLNSDMATFISGELLIADYGLSILEIAGIRQGTPRGPLVKKPE